MESHVKVLGILHIVWAGLSLLAAVVVLVVFGGIAGFAGLANQNDENAAAAVPILALIGGAVFFALLIFSLPGLICGFGLLKFRPWSRVLGIVLSALELFSIPFGTALGIYGFWVLLNQQTEALFRARTMLPPRAY